MANVQKAKKVTTFSSEYERSGAFSTNSLYLAFSLQIEHLVQKIEFNLNSE